MYFILLSSKILNDYYGYCLRMYQNTKRQNQGIDLESFDGQSSGMYTVCPCEIYIRNTLLMGFFWPLEITVL